MTMESWYSESYSIPATKMKRRSDTECVKHALKKWRGALPENLEKHNMEFENYILKSLQPPTSDPRHCTQFVFSDYSCSLCQKYPLMKTFPNGRHHCTNKSKTKLCPIIRYSGQSCLDMDSAYKQSNDDPTTMIATLQGTLDMLQQHK